MTTSCSQLLPGKTTTPILAAISGRPAVVADAAGCAAPEHGDGGVLDDGVGEQPVGHLDGTVARRGLVGRLDREPEGLAHTDVVDALETQRRQGPLDGRTLRIGDPGAQPDLHEHLVLHARITCLAPYQSASRRPLIRS